MKGSFESRIAKLEQYRTPRHRYVIRSDDTQAIYVARTAGHAYAVVPRKASSVAEWSLRYSPQETMQ